MLGHIYVRVWNIRKEGTFLSFLFPFFVEEGVKFFIIIEISVRKLKVWFFHFFCFGVILIANVCLKEIKFCRC